MSDLVIDFADKAERVALAISSPMTSVDCPVFHRFGPGVYMREVYLPAGAFVVGHRQKYEHMNVMLTGIVDMFIDGEVKRFKAPLIFTSPPGRKVGIVIESSSWINVYPTTETDVVTLEKTYLDKSPAALSREDELWAIHYRLRQPERDDFDKIVENGPFTADAIRAMSIDDRDQIPMPNGVAPKVAVRRSPIEGLGLFLSAPASKGETIAPARLKGMRTPAGRYTNHSHNPNACPVIDQNGDIYLVALRDIAGCVGGSHGEEITVDYRESLRLAGIDLGGRV